MDNLTKHIENFLIHIIIEKNHSNQTEKTYSFGLNIFAGFLNESNILITDKNCINNFIIYLKNRGNSDITIAGRLAALKSFFCYLVKKNIISKKKLPEIEKYKTTSKVIDIPSDDEVNLFIETIKNEYKQVKEKIGPNSNERVKARLYSLFRDLTFFTLIAATGLRISEALNIKLENINFNDYSIKILGKGAKERIIFFGIDKLINLFNQLLMVRNKFNIKNPYLFVSYQHKKVLTSRYIQIVMKNFLDKKSLPTTYTPHTLRHYYATRSIEKGANIKAISMLLGHANISTTLKMYFHISKKYLKETFETLNPFSNIVMPVAEMISKRYEMVLNL